MYEIIDNQTGLRVGGTYTNRRRARTRADKLDLAYGAYRYTVRPVRQPESNVRES
jgi:hypothetical protein